jgi:hypothetical protein
MRPGQAYDFATIQAKLYDSITLPADPKAYYVVSHETPTVDGFDIQLLRQQSYKPRLQGRPALLVAITDLDLSGTTQTASPVEVQLSAGDVEWIDPATAPVELLNRSESPVRFILLVFK